MRIFVNIFLLTSLVFSSVATADIYSGQNLENTFLKVTPVKRATGDFVRFEQCYAADPNDCLQVGSREYSIKELDKLALLIDRKPGYNSAGYRLARGTMMTGAFLSAIAIVATTAGAAFPAAIVVSGIAGFGIAAYDINHDRKYSTYLNGEVVATARFTLNGYISDFVAVLDYQLSQLN